MEIKKESMVMWRVTARGLRQIADWMNDYYSDSVWEAFQSHSEIALDICSWAVRAEHSNDGRITLGAASSRTGEPVSLTPERADIYVKVKPLKAKGGRDE